MSGSRLTIEVDRLGRIPDRLTRASVYLSGTPTPERITMARALIDGVVHDLKHALAQPTPRRIEGCSQS